MSWIQVVATIITSVFASSGLWAYLSSHRKLRDANTKLLLGLAHERIVDRGIEYLDRGYVTFDEHNDFIKYLAEPYLVFGGNGMAENIVNSVKKLPIISAKQALDKREGEPYV